MSATIQIEASDTTLYGTDNGVEGPALLFLNGAFGSQRDWTAIADQLGNRYRSVTFDARGRGRSPGPLCTHSMPTSTTSPQWSKARVLDQPNSGRVVTWSGSCSALCRHPPQSGPSACPDRRGLSRGGANT